MNETLHDINLSEQLSNKSTEESWNCLAENLTKLTEKICTSEQDKSELL